MSPAARSPPSPDPLRGRAPGRRRAGPPAQLNEPSGLALTGDGRLLIADRGNNRVRRVSPAGHHHRRRDRRRRRHGRRRAGPRRAAQGAERSGSFGRRRLPDPPTATTTESAGSPLAAPHRRRRHGRVRLPGDGGPATAADIGSPTGIAATPDGGFLIADGFQSNVRRVSPAGTITMVAGTGTRACGRRRPGHRSGARRRHRRRRDRRGRLPHRRYRHITAVRFVDADLRPGPQGPAGPPGQPGPSGSPGQTGLAGARSVGDARAGVTRDRLRSRSLATAFEAAASGPSPSRSPPR